MTEPQKETRLATGEQELSKGRDRYLRLVAIGCQIAHDVRNDLFPIRAHADMLKQKASGHDELSAGLEQITLASHELSGTLDQIQLLSRSEWQQKCRLDLKSFLDNTGKVLAYALAPFIRVSQSCDQELGARLITLDPGPVQVQLIDAVLEAQGFAQAIDSLNLWAAASADNNAIKILLQLTFNADAQFSDDHKKMMVAAIKNSIEFDPQTQSTTWNQDKLEIGLIVAAKENA